MLATERKSETLRVEGTQGLSQGAGRVFSHLPLAPWIRAALKLRQGNEPAEDASQAETRGVWGGAFSLASCRSGEELSFPAAGGRRERREGRAT